MLQRVLVNRPTSRLRDFILTLNSKLFFSTEEKKMFLFLLPQNNSKEEVITKRYYTKIYFYTDILNAAIYPLVHM